MYRPSALAAAATACSLLVVLTPTSASAAAGVSVSRNEICVTVYETDGTIRHRGVMTQLIRTPVDENGEPTGESPRMSEWKRWGYHGYPRMWAKFCE